MNWFKHLFGSIKHPKFQHPARNVSITSHYTPDHVIADSFYPIGLTSWFKDSMKIENVETTAYLYGEVIDTVDKCEKRDFYKTGASIIKPRPMHAGFPYKINFEHCSGFTRFTFLFDDPIIPDYNEIKITAKRKIDYYKHGFIVNHKVLYVKYRHSKTVDLLSTKFFKDELVKMEIASALQEGSIDKVKRIMIG